VQTRLYVHGLEQVGLLIYEVSYNPRVNPFWTNYDGIDVDNTEYGEVMSVGRKLFANPNY